MSNWKQLWLGYHPVDDNGYKDKAGTICVCGFDNSKLIDSAVAELRSGLKGMLGIEASITCDSQTGIIISKKESGIESEGYSVEAESSRIIIEAADENGALYGAFYLLRMIGCSRKADSISGTWKPSNPLRMLNHWDNMTGDIERGYSGNSFFFCDNQLVVNERTKDYARLIASIGINGVVINNVNVKGEATYLISERYYGELRLLSELFSSYGIKLFLSLNFAAPMELGDIADCDPLDNEVIIWWKDKMKEVYENIPNLGGFLVKADSEGRPGPFSYGRTQADGANMLADAIAAYGGVIIWRCFVYNCSQDWRDKKTDRARSAYDNFMPTDGDYHQNVILQIKNGPMDFQIREPVSPLFGGLKKTNQMMEVQIAQEYTGHQIDVCYLIPMFKEILDFKTCNGEKRDSVKDIISGHTYGNMNAGIVAVANMGNDANWTGNDMAAANLFGFGMLAYDTELSSEEILKEWAQLTLGLNNEVIDTIEDILMNSRETYEKYTSPLGIGWMVTPGVHYGCSVDGYEYSRWGTYHRADHVGIGVDRSDKGTGYAKLYLGENAEKYNQMDSCPDELLLFFHHVPYTHVLHSGKTVIQHIYDSHFEGFDEVTKMVEEFKKLKGKVPDDFFNLGYERFEMQLENAREWRDQVNSYFYRKSGIPDEKNRMIFFCNIV